MLKSGIGIRVSALYLDNKISSGEINSYGSTLGLNMSFLKKSLFSSIGYTYTLNTFNDVSNGHTSRLSLNFSTRVVRNHSLRLVVFLLNNNSVRQDIIRDFTETTIRLTYKYTFTTKKKKR